jgi:hypothetical protein
MRARTVFTLSLALPALNACLPDDTREPPAELVVRASADDALANGISSTEDGWSIRYDRFLVVLGAAELSGDDCDAYTESDYDRVLEMTLASSQRVSLLYGLGTCRFGFRIATPAWDTVLGQGVSAEDEIFLRTPGSDAHATDQGVSVRISGSATQLGTVKTFDWSFRRFIEYNDCTLGEGPDSGALSLGSKGSSTVDLVLRGEALFGSAGREPPAAARFEPFRAADDEHGDGNGEISLDELQSSPLPEGVLANERIVTLGDRVYLQLLPEIAKFQGTGTCQVRSSPERPDFGGP